MDHKFFTMDEAKRERIINACLAEFALYGYELASTNNIVKEARIAKGLLFHYFPSKKELYLFLYEYTSDLFINDYFELIDFTEKDLIKRLRQLVLNKIILQKKYPLMFNFLERAAAEDAKEVRDELKEKNENLQKLFGRFFEDIAFSKFRNDIDIPKAVNMIIWIITGFSNQYLNQTGKKSFSEIDHEDAIKEIEKYFDIVVKLFYKGEKQ